MGLIVPKVRRYLPEYDVYWVYLTVVLHLYDRKIIGRALSAGMETVQTAIPALEMAFANRPVRESLLFHADRG
jgi:transposase InsO family protein